MSPRLLSLTGLLLVTLATSGLAQTIAYPPPQVSAPLVTTAVSHQFLTGYPSLGGSFSQAQPGFTDISGTLGAAQCPIGTTGAIGCLQVGGGLAVTGSGTIRLGTVTSVSHMWFNAVDATGTLKGGQPSASDLTDGTTGSGTVTLSASPILVTPTLRAATINTNTATIPILPLAAQLNIGAVDGIAATISTLSSAAQDKIVMYRTNGTYTIPSTLTTGQLIGSILWSGYDGTFYNAPTASIQGQTTETWSDSPLHLGTAIVINATLTGTGTLEKEVMFQNGVAVGASGTPQGVGTVTTTGGYYVGSTNVITSSSAGVFTGGLTATISSSGAALNYACYNLSTGVFTYDSSSTCLVSSLRFKHDVVPVKDAVNTIMAFNPIEFTYNDDSNIKGRQIGLSAESVAAADPILATFDDRGRPEKVKYIEVIGLLTAAVQEQQHEIDDLKSVIGQRAR